MCVLATATALSACSGAAPRPDPAPERAPPADVTPRAAAPGRDAGPPLTEAEARAILFDAFRRAGYRIRHDVRVREDGLDVTLDGLDPERGVGYEYIAVEERGTDISDQERRLLREHYPRVLILDAAPEPELEERIRAFLAGIDPT